MIAKLKHHLLIYSSDPEVQRKSRVLLILILVLMVFSLIHLFLEIPEMLEDSLLRSESLYLAFEVMMTVLIFAIYLSLVRMANQFALTSEEQSVQIEKRAFQLQKIANITETRQITQNLHTLITETTNKIRAEFDFYHVALFFMDDAQECLKLEAIAVEGITEFTPGKYQLPVNTESLVGTTAVYQKPHVAQAIKYQGPHLQTSQQEKTLSQLTLPLIVHDKVIGVLDIQRQREDFSPDDITVFQILANQIAVNIDNVRLFAETEERLKETRALYDFNLNLADTNDLGEIYRRSAREFAAQLNGVRCIACTADEEQEQLIIQADYWHIQDGKVVDEFHPDTPIYNLNDFKETQKILQTHESLIYTDVLSNPEKEQECLEVALVHNDTSLGVIRVYREFTQPLFQFADIQLARTLANQVAISLTNAHLTTEAQGRVAQLSTLYRMSVVLSQANTLKEVFDGARREILSLIESSGMSIVLVNENEQTLNWIYAYEYGQEIDLSEVPPLPIEQGFSGYVYRTGKELHITKDTPNIEQYNSFVIGKELNSWLGLPMIVANKTIGVLSVESEAYFSERDSDLLRTIVGPIAIGINNLMQFEAIESALAVQSEQRLHLQTAAEIAATAASVLNQYQLIQDAVELIKSRFQLYYVGIFLVDKNNHMAVLQAGSGEEGRIQLAQNHALLVGGQSLIGGATADGVPRIIQDVTQDKEWRPNAALPLTKSELALPLNVRNKIIGAVTVQSETPNLFTPEMISTLQTMSDQLAIAIENAQLLQQAQLRAERQQYINQVSAQLHQSSDVEEIIGVGLQALSNYLDNSPVDLYLGRKHNTQTKPLSEKNASV